MTEDATHLVADFDHHTQAYAANSRAICGDLRARCPVAWTPAHGGYWVVSNYEGLAQASRDTNNFSSYKDVPSGPFQGTSHPNQNPVRQGITEADPPQLLKVRQALSPFFAPAAVEAMRPRIRDLTTFCINTFIERGSADLLKELAGPVPSLVTMELLGVPLRDWKRYADVMHRMIYTPPDSPEREEVHTLHHWATEQFYELAAERRNHPGEDLISFLATLEVDGQLMAMDEVVGNINLIMAGGVDTTTTLMANTFVHLSRNPADRAWLISDRSRLQAACEEFLRYYSPVQSNARTVANDCQLDGTSVRQHDRVLLLWASANLDPEAFDQADEIQLDRHPNRHVSFGLGPHRCLGNSIARAVWSIVVDEVLTRLPDFEVNEGGAIRYPSIGIINGWISVPVRFTPGEKAPVDVAL
jgi:cytochrome P450